MLVKGTIKGNILSTEIGQFFVSRKGTDEVSGVFELSQIQASSIEKPVNVDGFSTVVNIPVLEAKVIGIYTQLYAKAEKSKQINLPLDDKKLDKTSSNINSKKEPIATNQDKEKLPGYIVTKASVIPTRNGYQAIEKSKETFDMSGKPIHKEGNDDYSREIKLFGKPLKDLGETYKIDASLSRDKQKEIISYFQAKDISFSMANQEWLIGQVCA